MIRFRFLSELRNPFDFGGQLRNTINNHTDLLQQQHQQQQQHIDHNYIINLKSEIENVNNNNDIIFNNRCANINLMENIKVEDSIDIVKNSLDISNNFNINDNKETVMWSHQQQQQPPNHQHIQQREEEQDIIDYMNPTTITMAYTILDDDDEKLMTVENFDDVLKIKQVQNASNVNNSLQTYDEYQNLTTYDTPDESTCSSSISNRSTNQKLKLNITAASSYVQDEEPSIKTSDVIDTINEIESTRGFNILQYINDEVSKIFIPLNTVETKLIFFFVQELQLVAETADSIATTSTAGDADDTFNTTFSSEDFQRNASTSKRATRKRYEEESDEEYLPPSEKRVKRSRNCKDLSMHDVEQSMTKSKRGRPPKRNVSISSDDYYGDTPEARYRELRDKNNEASRKSRLKRKIKENDLETEGDQLDERNRILRVQVEELEKTVTRFRNNLMTLLLNKKT